MTKIVNYYQKEKNKYYDKVISLTLINLNWYKNRDESVKKERIKEKYCLDDEERGLMFRVMDVNLDKYATVSHNNIVSNEKLYKLLTINNEKELDRILDDEPLIEEYANKLKNLSKDEKYREGIMTEAMNRYFMEMEAFDAGEQSGIEKGIAKKENDIVLSMYEDKVPFKTISKYTKLSIDKIKVIINSKK